MRGGLSGSRATSAANCSRIVFSIMTEWKAYRSPNLERLKAIRYTSEGRTIVQATSIGTELAEIFKKLGISAPKTILAVG